jgi:hypothetical protein
MTTEVPVHFRTKHNTIMVEKEKERLKGSVAGRLVKLKTFLIPSSSSDDANFVSSVQYTLAIGETEIPLNAYIGESLSLKFSGEIRCIYCDKKTKKSYNQGYCFPCCQKLARCDFCIVRPETCHHHLGTCREPEWATTHCLIPHVVYLANTSGVKVGITRGTQIPTRWIDQGAVQALPILSTPDRYLAGQTEVALKAHINDKTDWRKMLKGDIEAVDLKGKKEELWTLLNEKKEPANTLDYTKIKLLEEQTITSIHYPVLEYPKKVVSINLEKTPEIKGTLLGIKGQYLILDIGVLNIRNLAGYVVSADF